MKVEKTGGPAVPKLDEMVDLLVERQDDLSAYCDFVQKKLKGDPFIKNEIEPVAIKGRVKDPDSLRKKIEDKYDPDMRRITPETLFQNITDLIGTRLVVSHKDLVEPTVRRVREMPSWRILDEEHYVWHPEEYQQVASTGGEATRRETGYRSRHLILVETSDMPEEDKPRCELQIRTILEEAIFENDHKLRHKSKHDLPESATRAMTRLSEILACADMLISDIHHTAGKLAKPK